MANKKAKRKTPRKAPKKKDIISKALPIVIAGITVLVFQKLAEFAFSCSLECALGGIGLGGLITMILFLLKGYMGY